MLSVCDVTGVVSRAKSEGPARCVCGSPPARAVSCVVCCKIVRTRMLLNRPLLHQLYLAAKGSAGVDWLNRMAAPGAVAGAKTPAPIV